MMGFGLFSVMFVIVFILIVGMIIVNLIREIGQWNQNNNSPRLTVTAAVVSKRMDVSHYNHANAGDVSGGHGYHTTTSTSYYVTFQVDSGDRM